MTRSTDSVGTTITITSTSTSSIATRSKTEPISIGFLPSYLPSSTVEIRSLPFKNPSPYPLNNPPYPLDVTLVDKAPPPYPSDHHLQPPYFIPIPSNSGLQNPSPVNLYNKKGQENSEKEEIMIALSQLKCKAVDEEQKEFFKTQTTVTDIINDANSSLSVEEKENFKKELKKTKEMRNKYVKGRKDENVVKENETDANNEAGDPNSVPCSERSVISLLLKFPQLLLDVIICVKGGMAGITTFLGAIFFTLSLTAGLFTTYYLILYCICRRSKRTIISEFLHSLICTAAFFLVSFYSADEDLMAFGYLVMVPYGSEVCWTSWNFIKKQKSLLSFCV